MTDPGEILTQSEIDTRLKTMPGWEKGKAGKSIEKHYVFSDFLQAMKFMSVAAPQIQELNHHPEWTNVFNKIHVRLWTHNKGGVTKADFMLASLLDDCYATLESA